MTNLTLLSPTQMILFIILLEILSVPIIAFLFSWLTSIWYSKKKEYLADILKGVCNIFELAKEEYSKNKEKKEKNKENGL